MTDKTNIIDSIISDLGDPVEGNTYKIAPYKREWWIDHMRVGSGEPLRQFLNEAISDAINDNASQDT